MTNHYVDNKVSVELWSACNDFTSDSDPEMQRLGDLAEKSLYEGNILEAVVLITVALSHKAYSGAKP
jgi:hypothetical protein